MEVTVEEIKLALEKVLNRTINKIDTFKNKDEIEKRINITKDYISKQDYNNLAKDYNFYSSLF